MINLNIIINYWDNINEKQLKDRYKLFSTESTIYIKYIKYKTNEENNVEEIELSEYFNFLNMDILNNFIHKRFKQIKKTETYEINDVCFELYKNEKVIMKDRLDWEYTGFFKFKNFLDEYLKFINCMNIEQNTKILNNYLIKNTNNTITKQLPPEIIEIILSSL